METPHLWFTNSSLRSTSTTSWYLLEAADILVSNWDGSASAAFDISVTTPLN